MKIWVGDRLWEEDEARISPFDHALITGDGVFEVLKVSGGRPFALRRHLERLHRSASGMGLALPEGGAFQRAIEEVVAANGVADGVVRVTLTGGPSAMGTERGTAGPTLIVTAGGPRTWPPTASVAITPWPRNERSAVVGLKTVSYAENVIALHWAHGRGALEAVFPNLAGRLCEGTGTNVFLAHRGRLITPTLASGCLAGVTRQLLLELGVAEEEDVPVGALEEAEEAFLTSSTRDVQPIDSVDGSPLPAAPGPLTKTAADAFADLCARDDDP